MNRRVIPAIWAAAIIAAVLFVTRAVPIHTDLTAFTPPGEDEVEAALLEAVRSGPASRTLLMRLSGAPPERLAAASDRLAERLRGHAGFDTVENGAGRQVPTTTGTLFRYRYLLSPRLDGPEPFSEATLRRALETRLRELMSPMGTFSKAFLARDPTGEWLRLLARLRPQEGPERRHDRWFSGDGAALLLARTRAPALDVEAQQRALRTVEAAAAGVLEPGIDWQVTGPGALAVSARDTIRTDTTRLSVAASLLLVLLLAAVYRSWRPVLAGAMPLLAAVAAGAAVTGAVFGALHAITLALGLTLLGVTLDYPLHFMSQRSRVTSREAIRRLWPTLRLGAVTTAVGYLTLATTEFAGLAQLGVFAASGLLAAAATTRWVLPGLFPEGRDLAPVSLGAGLPRPTRGVRAGALVVASGAAVLVLALPLPWQDDLRALSPVPERLQQQERELRRAFGAPEPNTAVFVAGDDVEQVLRRSEALRPDLERLAQRGRFAGYEMAADFLPSAETQRARQAGLPGRERLHRRLAAAREGLPFQEGLFRPFIDDVARSRELPPLTLDGLTETPAGPRAAALLHRSGDGWYGLVPLTGVADAAALAEAFAGLDRPGVRFVDLRTRTTAMLTRFRHEALTRVGWGLLAIAAVLLLQLRAPGRVVRVLLPVAGALAVDLAVLYVLGTALTLFHLITLVLVAGLGIDYALFFSRRESVGERTGTLHALVLCAVSSTAVFGILAVSEIPVLRAVGLTAAIGVLASFILAAALAQPSAPDAAKP